jgi:hypothetical protein
MERFLLNRVRALKEIPYEIRLDEKPEVLRPIQHTSPMFSSRDSCENEYQSDILNEAYDSFLSKWFLARTPKSSVFAVNREPRRVAHSITHHSEHPIDLDVSPLLFTTAEVHEEINQPLKGDRTKHIKSTLISRLRSRNPAWVKEER